MAVPSARRLVSRPLKKPWHAAVIRNHLRARRRHPRPVSKIGQVCQPVRSCSSPAVVGLPLQRRWHVADLSQNQKVQHQRTNRQRGADNGEEGEAVRTEQQRAREGWILLSDVPYRRVGHGDRSDRLLQEDSELEVRGVPVRSDSEHDDISSTTASSSTERPSASEKAGPLNFVPHRTPQDPSWRKTRMWMQNLRRSVCYAERNRSNPFAEVGLHLVPSLKWCNTSSCYCSFGDARWQRKIFLREN